MRIGVTYPQTELGSDVGALRAYASAVEELGYTHILAYDHVVGADPEVHKNWAGPYNASTTFHEPFVMFGFLAALTRVELVTGIIILPQRQTALVAKQAAEVDILCEGRFRLGVGVGWNDVEYTALGQSFESRGRRMSEQIPLLRSLWTEPTVNFEGEFDHIDGAGIMPMPLQRPIPIWIGGASPAAYRRVGQLADGWFPMVPPGKHLENALATINAAAIEAGRDPSSIGMEGQVVWQPNDHDKFMSHVQAWRLAGASHIAINTMNAGCRNVDEHLAAISLAADLVR
jgi:probable F420-dependent oxidoreductase